MLSKETPKKLIKTKKDLEKIIQMMHKGLVDSISIDGIEIKITKHLAKIEDVKQKPKTAQEIKQEEEALLFHSA